MCKEDLGALIFFVDPLSAHPHQADIDSLVRLANCGNVIVCLNPTAATSMMYTFKCALAKGSRGMVSIPNITIVFVRHIIYACVLIARIFSFKDPVFLRNA